jgi:hypothetical protein
MTFNNSPLCMIDLEMIADGRAEQSADVRAALELARADVRNIPPAIR